MDSNDKKDRIGDHVDSENSLLDYLKTKGGNHKCYKYYTRRAVAESILEKHSVFLSDGSNWNDIQDRTNFNPDDDPFRRFALCLSFTQTESVAMWMLYGKNDGVMLDFKRGIIKDCLSQTAVECGKVEDGKFVGKGIIESPEVKIELVDIVYYTPVKDNPNVVTIKRSDERFESCPVTVINKIQFCKKTYPWQYECECRLIATISKSCKQIEKCNVLRIPFSDFHINALRENVFHAPNVKNNCIYERSTLTGKIDWII